MDADARARPRSGSTVMEFARGEAVHEAQYLAGPFGAPGRRLALAEPTPGRIITRP